MTEYFRVDRRLFSVGEKIETANEYYERFPEAERRIEDALEAGRPSSKSPRRSCLFVFECLASAKKHWSKMSGGKLYRVAIDEVGILHRGDMALMDAIKDLPTLDYPWRPLVDSYWRSELSPSPEIEVLVKEAVVTEVLSSSDDERRAHLRERWFGPAGRQETR